MSDKSRDPKDVMEAALAGLRKVQILAWREDLWEYATKIDAEAARIMADLNKAKSRAQAAEAAQTSARAAVRNLLAAGLEDQAVAVAAALNIDLEKVREEMAAQPATRTRSRRSSSDGSEKKKPYIVVAPDGKTWNEYSMYTACRAVARKEGLAKNYIRPGTVGGFDSKEFEKTYGIELGQPFQVAGRVYIIKKEEAV